MDDRELLSDEERDALAESGIASEPDEGAARSYDFRDPSRMLNSRLPGLDSVHETFAGGMQGALAGLVGRAVEIEVGETSLTRLGDYQQSLPMPVSVHAAPVRGREQSMLLVAEGAFVYACVDAFFGGRGGVAPSSEREFSGSERRLCGVLAAHAFEHLGNAWAAACGLKFSDAQPLKQVQANGARDDQIMVVSRFRVDLLPGQGEFHVSMPYALLDSVRGYLHTGPRSEESSRDWRARFCERVAEVEVDVRAVFPGVRISFGELVSLAPGDFIPMGAQNAVHVMAGKRVVHFAEPGTSNGMAAAKIGDRPGGGAR